MNIWILGFGWLAAYIHQEAKALNAKIAAVTRDSNKVEDLKKMGLSPILVNQGEHFIPDYIPFLPDVVVMCTPPSKDPESYSIWCTYFLGIHSSLQHAGCEPMWIYTGSTGIYPDESGLFDEMYSVSVSNARQIYLVMHEQVLQSQVGDKLCIARLGGLIGGERNAVRFYHHQADRFHALEPVNMIHGKDAAHFILHAAQKQLRGIYNVCHPDHPTREVFYQKACLQNGIEPNEMNHKGAFKNRIISSDKMILSSFHPMINI
ncbi:MAG: hypothetical protein ACK4GL_07550 [Flavobacteriales bacterium]